MDSCFVVMAIGDQNFGDIRISAAELRKKHDDLIKVNNGKIIEQRKYNLENYKNKKQQAFEKFYGSAKYNESWNSIKNNFEDNIEENSKKEIMKDCEYLYDFYEF